MLDARPLLNAEANAIFNGGGFESTKKYKNCEFTFCNIANIHAVTKAHEALMKISRTPELFQEQREYAARINQTGYY